VTDRLSEAPPGPARVTWEPRCAGEAHSGWACSLATDDAEEFGAFHVVCEIPVPVGCDVVVLTAGSEFWEHARENASAAARLLHGAARGEAA
jgi:hypothetical protein